MVAVGTRISPRPTSGYIKQRIACECDGLRPGLNGCSKFCLVAVLMKGTQGIMGVLRKTL